MSARARAPGPVVLSAREVSYAFEANGGPLVLDGASVELRAGEFLAVLGPNGAGKSTLLRLLSGLALPTRGAVYLGETPAKSLSRNEWARRVALVPQHEEARFGFTVRELVALGRAPHSGWLGTGGSGDEAHAEVTRALERCDLVSLAERPVDALSGGEHKRVLVARALAQRAPVLLLDEPVASLDVRHQLGLCALLAEGVRAGEFAAVAVLHDLNLASQFCDRVLLLREGRVFAQGPTREVLTAERVRALYEAPVHAGELPGAHEARFFVPLREQ